MQKTRKSTFLSGRDTLQCIIYEMLKMLATEWSPWADVTDHAECNECRGLQCRARTRKCLHMSTEIEDGRKYEDMLIIRSSILIFYTCSIGAETESPLSSCRSTSYRQHVGIVLLIPRSIVVITCAGAATITKLS